MHELSVAVSLIEAVSRQVELERCERVRTVFVRVGALSGIVREALAFAFDVAAEQTVVQGAVLEIEDVPVVVFCSQCGGEVEG